MALLDRVATLIRANLNELIDRAESPEILIKQVVQDMENQLMQVKTQVAIAIADQHVLDRKQKENEEKTAEWARKAELAVDKKQDDLARAALERSMTHRTLAESFAQQMEDQKGQVENLKNTLRKLEQKLAEAQSKRDALIAQHRRSRALSKASEAQLNMGDPSTAADFDRMKDKVHREEAVADARSEMVSGNVEERLAAIEKQDKIERMLSDLKARRGQ